MKTLEGIRNLAIGLGVMILLPMAVRVGTRLIIKGPSWEERSDLKKQLKEKKISKKEFEAQEEEYDTRRKAYEQYLFYISTISGVAAIAAGAMVAVPFLGMGLILGGVICLSLGYWDYWHHLDDTFKFISLILALIILIGAGYRVMRKKR